MVAPTTSTDDLYLPLAFSMYSTRRLLDAYRLEGLSPETAFELVAEYEVVKAAMTAADGNKTAAAAQLEISRGTLYQKLDKYRLLDH